MTLRSDIVEWVPHLDYNDRLEILTFLKNELRGKHINEAADGTRINLDILPDTIIYRLHYLVKKKLALIQE